MFVVLFFSLSSMANAVEDERQLLEEFQATQVAEQATASDEQRVVAKAMNSTRSVAVGMRYPVGPSGSSVSLPATPGFEMKSDYSRNIELFAEYRERSLGIEVAMAFDDERSHELSFYGSSLGTLTVKSPWVITGKYYVPISFHDVEPYVGIGFQQMVIDGFYGLGGTAFETKGDGWHAVGVLGAKFPAWKNYSVVAEYRLADTEIETRTTAGPIENKKGAQLLFGVSLHF